ncbi:NAD(P)-dependent oxidoreductase [Marinoscillum sp.]|uniref:NAD(P)-dependent oxidoreductase n=1 Tax=Marinoscillum sp. TaxID=2024838 RepID=UPI003BAC63D8
MVYDMISCGQFGQQLSELVNNSYGHVAKCIYKESLVQKDLYGKNAIAGFYQFDHLDLSEIKWIHAFGAGVDDYLKQPTIQPDVILTRTLGYMDKRIGEYCLAYILEDLKSVVPTHDNQRSHFWKRTNLNVLYNKKVLILGTGFVGQGIASALYPLIEKIAGINASGISNPAFHQIIAMKDIHRSKLEQYDIVISALPLTPTTTNFLNKSFFALLHDALFMNVGRGKSLVESDLLWALENGHVRKAVLDVYQTEPVPADSPFWDHNAVMMTPHHSGLTTFDDVRKSFEESVDALKNGIRNHLFVDISKGY